jgi:hypothetical protein
MNIITVVVNFSRPVSVDLMKINGHHRLEASTMTEVVQPKTSADVRPTRATVSAPAAEPAPSSAATRVLQAGLTCGLSFARGVERGPLTRRTRATIFARPALKSREILGF